MKFLAKSVLLSLLAGATAGVVYGDPQGGWLSPNGLSGGAAAANPSASATVDLTGSMPLVDLHARVQLLREQTRNDARHMQHLQQVARQAKDVIKLNCVNDKLVQVKPQLNIADSLELELQTANEAGRITVFSTISQAAEAIHRLREEADQCIGEAVNFGSESSNSFTGPHAPDDPTKGFNHNPIEPPGYASPFN